MERRTFIKGIAAGSGLLIASSTLPSVIQADDDIIHRLENRANPSTLEKKHVPALEAPSAVKKGEWFTVKVKVGYLIEHPSTQEHWIKEITLMVDRWKLAETEFEVGGLSAPCVQFKMRLNHDAVLKARAECNLHGTWESDSVEIKVS
jgi:superoxide reductase